MHAVYILQQSNPEIIILRPASCISPKHSTIASFRASGNQTRSHMSTQCPARHRELRQTLGRKCHFATSLGLLSLKGIDIVNGLV